VSATRKNLQRYVYCGTEVANKPIQLYPIGNMIIIVFEDNVMRKLYDEWADSDTPSLLSKSSSDLGTLSPTARDLETEDYLKGLDEALDLQEKYESLDGELNDELSSKLEGGVTSSPRPPSVPNETLFVTNFNEQTTTREDLEMLFGPYDQLYQIDIDMKGNYAFVQFQTVDAAARAKACTDGGYLDGHKLHVEYVRPIRTQPPVTQPPVPNETLFVLNFNEETTSREDLQMLFEPYGELHRIDMKRNYAFVQFKTVDAAARAKDATNGGKLDQNEITVEFVRRVRRQLSARRAEEIRRRGSHLNSQCAPDVSDISIDDMDDEVLKLHQRRCMYFTRKRQRDFEQALLNGK